LWDTTAIIIITTSDYGNPYSTGSIVRDGLSGFEHTLSDATHDENQHEDGDVKLQKQMVGWEKHIT